MFDYETADSVRVDVDFPDHWGKPKGDAGTPERRAWIIGNIRGDNPDDDGRNAAAALEQARALGEPGSD